MPDELCQRADWPTSSLVDMVGLLSFPNSNLDHMHRLSLNSCVNLMSYAQIILVAMLIVPVM